MVTTFALSNRRSGAGDELEEGPEPAKGTTRRRTATEIAIWVMHLITDVAIDMKILSISKPLAMCRYFDFRR
jgi:hypothetical protein